MNTDEKCFKHFMKKKYNNKLRCPHCSKEIIKREEEKSNENIKKYDKLNSHELTNNETTSNNENVTIKETTSNKTDADNLIFHKKAPVMKRLKSAGKKESVGKKGDTGKKKSEDQSYLYACPKCRKQISAFRGTIFHKTKTPLLKWFLAIHLLTSFKKGVSAIQLSKEIDVIYRTAHKMLHKIREVMAFDEEEEMFEGIVEIDETYISNRKRGLYSANKTKQGRSGDNKMIIVGLYNRDSKKIVLKHVDKVDEKTMLGLVKKYVKVGSRVMTDEWTSYGNLRLHGYIHGVVNHNESIYKKGEDIHSNMPENFWGGLKGGLGTTYQGVTKEKISNYLNEFSWRFNYRLEENGIFDIILKRV